MRNILIALTGVATLSAVAACSDAPTSSSLDDSAGSFSQAGDSQAGVTPLSGEGNISGESLEEVCYGALDLPGIDGLVHFKADWDADLNDGAGGWTHSDPHLTVTTDGEPGRYLDFDANGGVVYAAVVKGGPAYNVYDYTPAGVGSDGHLHSPAFPSDHPRAGQVPEISHYNFCYVPADGNGFEGCTIGYWKNHDGSVRGGNGPVRASEDSWAATAYATGTMVAAVFEIDTEVYQVDPDDTFREALDYDGGPDLSDAARLLLRQAVAALLSATHPDVGYEWSASTIIQEVNAALATGDREAILALTDDIDRMNNAGCPL